MNTEEQEELLMQTNHMVHELLREVRDLKGQLSKPEADTCSSEDALIILGLGNVRYLTYYHKKRKILDRRPGANGFVYYKAQCKALAEKFRNKEEIVPAIKDIYDKASV